MTINSKTLAVLLIVFLFGGILASSALGWWQTTSDKMPALYTEGEFAGEANPADIRGSYTFADIAHVFNITPEVLAQAFDVTTSDPASFQVKSLEEIYAESPLEIGTASVRIFVAFYTGLPYDLTGAEATYLPESAADILKVEGKMNPEQKTWLETHTVSAPSAQTQSEPAPISATPALPTVITSENTDYLVKGKTTFGELLGWGVPQDVIEGIIGAPIPNPAMAMKDFASANGLNFETLKPALQAEVDKVKK